MNTRLTTSRRAGSAMALSFGLLLTACVSNPSQPGDNSFAQALGALSSAAAQSGVPMGALGSQASTHLQTLQLVVQSLDNMDETREIELGRQLSSVLLGSARALNDEPTQRYVNRLGRWISLHSSRPNLPWTFVVLDNPGFNAFAAPGGYVFVTKGLLDRTPTEAELAGVLAHEITHVTQKHHLKAMVTQARTQLGTQAVGHLLSKNGGDTVSGMLLNLGRDLYAKGLDRADEFEADRMGVALAARAGMDPYGLLALLQQMSAEQPDHPAYALAFSTHPPSLQRVEYLRQAMGNRLDKFAASSSPTLAQRVRSQRSR